MTGGKDKNTYVPSRLQVFEENVLQFSNKRLGGEVPLSKFQNRKVLKVMVLILELSYSKIFFKVPLSSCYRQ